MPNCSKRLMLVYADPPNCHVCKVRIKSGRCRNWCNGFADYQELKTINKQKEKGPGMSPGLMNSSVKRIF